jgi:ABC-type tungstate transport system permease subunit
MKILEKVVAFELTISSLCEESGCNFKEKKRKKNREANEELTVWYIPGGTRY